MSNKQSSNPPPHPAGKSLKASSRSGNDMVPPVLGHVTVDFLGGRQNFTSATVTYAPNHSEPGAMVGGTIFDYIDRVVEEKTARVVEEKTAGLQKKVEVLEAEAIKFCCPVCLTNRKDWRIHCGHLLCFECGTKMVNYNRQNNKQNICPLCKKYAGVNFSNPTTGSRQKNLHLDLSCGEQRRYSIIHKNHRNTATKSAHN